MLLTLPRSPGTTSRRAPVLVTEGIRPADERRQGREPLLDRGAGAPDDIVDEWGMQSFPASDPPANW